MADVSASAARMREANGDAKPGDVARARKGELVDAFADAAGVATVVAAVEKSTRTRAAAGDRLAGHRLARQAPARPAQAAAPRPRQGRQGADRRRPGVGARRPPRCSGRAWTRPSAAVADDVAPQLTPPWAAAVRRASVSRLPDLNDALDKAVTGTDLGVARTPLWWRLVRVLQWLLLLTALGGGLWLGAPGGDGLPAAARADDPGLRRAAGADADAARRRRAGGRARRCCAGCSSRWSARSRGRGRPTSGCAPRSARSPSGWWSSRSSTRWRPTAPPATGSPPPADPLAGSRAGSRPPLRAGPGRPQGRSARPVPVVPLRQPSRRPLEHR